MHHIAGYDRSQTLLLPESLDECIGPENPVRFIEAFIDGLDLTAAGFARVTPDVTGRPGYAPTDRQKFYIYGYVNRVRSSRRLEAR
jgi:transposase